MSAENKLIIFDCDGTLVDSQHIIHAAMTRAYETANLAPPEREATMRVVGLSLVEAITHLSPEFDLSLCERLDESYKQSFTTLRADSSLTEPMFSGAMDILHKLKDQVHLQLGIATGKSRRGVDSFLNRENLHGFFDTIQTADDAPSKPHPAMLEQALLETGHSASDAMMIGDTSFDMHMAVSAGVRAIGVSWGYHTSHELMGAGACRVVNRFSELEELL